MTEPRFGLWGGSPPGAWCWIGFDRDKILRHGDAGAQYVGTKAQAEDARAQFLREGADPEGYTVEEFDPEREPAATEDVPTEAQARALRELQQGNPFWWQPHITTESTRRPLFRNGWVFDRVREGGFDSDLVVTVAGRRALERFDAATSSP